MFIVEAGSDLSATRRFGQGAMKAAWEIAINPLIEV
jgi:hypothetical protein